MQIFKQIQDFIHRKEENIMQKMTREYVLKTLREEHLWKEGESDTFS